MKNAACYIRVSTDEQTEYSPDAQLKEIKDYAARHDFLIAPEHIFIDAGISGRKAAKRPQFQNMIAAAKSKERPFEVILVWKFSRFARNQEESILYKSLLRRECKVEVVSITEETGGNVFGSLIERIIEWMDEFYSIRLSDEVRSKMTLIAEKGIVQTAPPFGYKYDPEKRGYVIIPEEAEWIKFMAEKVLERKSYRSIANHLNDCGVRTHRGSKIEPRTVEYILRNVTNRGALHWSPNQANHSSRNPYSENTIIVENACPAIYSAEYHEKIIAELDRRARVHQKHAKSGAPKKHWLSGLLRCSNCGSSMSYSSSLNNFQCYKYAKCQCDISHSVVAPKIEAAVLEALGQVTVTDDFIKSITKSRSNDMPTYEKETARLNDMLARAKRAYIEGLDTIEEYASNKNKIEAELNAVKEKIAAQKVEHKSVEDVTKQFSRISALLKSNAENEIKRIAIGEIVEKIIYSKPDESIKIFFYL